MSKRERYRHATIRRTGKPHVYRERGQWLVLERTGPSEWWTTHLVLDQETKP